VAGRVAHNRHAADSNSSGESIQGSGGNLDDILKRMGNVEADVSTMKGQVSAILAVMPHLATKVDLAVVPYLATKADLSTLEASIIKWLIGTLLAAVGLSFTIAKFVH
jgi:hypothetical protein